MIEAALHQPAESLVTQAKAAVENHHSPGEGLASMQALYLKGAIGPEVADYLAKLARLPGGYTSIQGWLRTQLRKDVDWLNRPYPYDPDNVSQQEIARVEIGATLGLIDQLGLSDAGADLIAAGYHKIPPLERAELKAAAQARDWRRPLELRRQLADLNGPEKVRQRKQIIDRYLQQALEQGSRYEPEGDFMEIDDGEVVTSLADSEGLPTPSRFDPEEVEKRLALAGQYGGNDTTLTVVGPRGTYWVGPMTDKNIKALEKAGYKPGPVGNIMNADSRFANPKLQKRWEELLKKAETEQAQPTGDTPDRPPAPPPVDANLSGVALIEANPEVRKQVEDIISQIKAMCNEPGIPGGNAFEPTDIAWTETGQKLWGLQKQLSDILNLPPSESFQTIEDTIKQGKTIITLTHANVIAGSQKRGTLDQSVSLLREMYSSTSAELQLQLDQFIKDYLDKTYTNAIDKFPRLRWDAAGLDTNQRQATRHSHSVIAMEFRDLFSSWRQVPTIVEAFINRNRAAIADNQTENEWRRRLQRFEQDLAAEHGIKITYLEAGDAILERMTPAEIIEQEDREISAARYDWRQASTDEPSEEIQQRIDRASERIARVINSIEDPVKAAHLLKSQRDYVRYYARPALERLFPEKFELIDKIMGTESKDWVKLRESLGGKEPKPLDHEQTTQRYLAAQDEVAKPGST